MANKFLDYFKCIYDEEQKIWKSASVATIYDQTLSVGQLIFESLKKNPNNILQIDDLYNLTTTNAEALNWSISIARYLKDHGIDHKTVVGISARNSTYLLPVVAGCFFNCTPFHAVNPDLDEDTIAHCYGLTKPKLIFCDGEIYERIKSTTKDYCDLILTITEHREGVPKVQDVLGTSSRDTNYEPQKLVEGYGQPVAILCSSGTTGKPKAVCVSTEGLISNNPFGYGVTEIGAITICVDKTRLKSVGQLRANLMLRIMNENGENLGANEIGEVLVYCPIPWRGYYNNPEETANVLDSDGWFHTGDLGYMDQDHFLFLVDRKKEILKYQGHHYWPNEIEHVVAELPDVLDVCVVSVFDETKGDAAGALVVKKEKSSLTAEEVINHVKQRLIVPHKQLNAGVYFVQELPYNSNNKCLRNKAKEILRDLIENK